MGIAQHWPTIGVSIPELSRRRLVRELVTQVSAGKRPLPPSRTIIPAEGKATYARQGGGGDGLGGGGGYRLPQS